MYLARTIRGNETYFIIRESYRDGDLFKCRDLFHLGTDPAGFIRYPGGNGYYYDESLCDALADNGVAPDADALDDIFWDFLDPHIKRVIEGFQRNRGKGSAVDETTQRRRDRRIHLFDKRRLHFLRVGRSDQRGLLRLRPSFFKALWLKSRDEIEQYFSFQERILAPRELALYVFTIFNLESEIRNPLQKSHPATISKSDLDDYFLAALCRLNDDQRFWAGMERVAGLQAYLKRYVIMYFDHDFPRPDFAGAYVRDFMNRHRVYQPPQAVRLNAEEAARWFNTSWEQLKQMNRRELTRAYRKLALKFHPDMGGDPKIFVKITEIYQGLLRRKSS